MQIFLSAFEDVPEGSMLLLTASPSFLTEAAAQLAQAYAAVLPTPKRSYFTLPFGSLLLCP